MREARDAVLEYVKHQLYGPVSGPEETLRDRPHKRYVTGILYPVSADWSGLLEDEALEGATGGELADLPDDPVTLSAEWLPAAVGVSFYVAGRPRLKCEVWGARYVKSGRDYARCRIAEPDSPEAVTLEPPEATETTGRESVLGGRAAIRHFWRTFGDGSLVTVSLVNSQVQPGIEAGDIDPERVLLQTGFAIETESGVLEYPSVSFLSTDPEERELRLQYRNRRTYAIGHGCAAGWRESAAGSTRRIWTDFLPRHELAPLTYETGRQLNAQSLRWLMDRGISAAALCAGLEELIDDYEAWTLEQRGTGAELKGRLAEAVPRILEPQQDAIRRMREGVKALAVDSKLREAFQLANEAMFLQMRHSERDLGGQRRALSSAVDPTIDYGGHDPAWRPFQLAFLLLTLGSLREDVPDERDTVDLLWFPTGGGKTEAYLALAATEIFVRRLRHGNNGAGTTVISRYTLRLLTAQQFQRTAALICACELIRRRESTLASTVPITLGLWVGQADNALPNRILKAKELLEQCLEDERPGNPFQLERCPWCGTEIIPSKRTESRSAYGVQATDQIFRFYCPGGACPFHALLPIQVVDDMLYREPPTILLGTVDKFARLAWEPESGRFFGGDGTLPPSLIIQDETHLLSGPLGTTVGLYESAVDELIRLRGGTAKIISSTATIRSAGEQIAGLFGRKASVFPPPGLDASDSYFAREDRSGIGRLYVGLMAQGHTQQTTMIHACAALLEAPVEVELSQAQKDAWWTLVAYHNSLRELGGTVTLSQDDIPARVKVIAADQARLRELGDDDVVELTSNVGPKLLPEILRRMGVPADGRDPISVLVCTNMLSVGIDVPRLGLMVVNGQPKSAAEYIQATSRVGRGEVPGIVLSVYNASKPRDRSHFERFLSFHQALYRFVEPSSVTPFSLPARERALHALLTIVVRHGLGLGRNDSAGDLDPADPAIDGIIERIRMRAETADPGEHEDTERELRRKLQEWKDMADAAEADGKVLYYSERSRQHHSLLTDFGRKDPPSWQTLHSMRSVDRECRIRVVGEDS